MAKTIRPGQIWRMTNGDGKRYPRSYYYVTIARARGDISKWLVAEFTDGIGLGNTTSMLETELQKMEWVNSLVGAGASNLQDGISL